MYNLQVIGAVVVALSVAYVVTIPDAKCRQHYCVHTDILLNTIVYEKSTYYDDDISLCTFIFFTLIAINDLLTYLLTCCAIRVKRKYSYY